MVGFQLFALVFALSLWDGLALECAYVKISPYVCQQLEDAYNQNIEAETVLKVDTFKDDRRRIHLANQKVRDALKKNETSALKWALYIALSSETNALFQVTVSCAGSQKERPACRQGIAALCLAIEALVNAIMEIDGDEEITKAYEEFEISKFKGTECCGKHCYVMGLKVSDVLQRRLSNDVQSATITHIPIGSKSN